MEYNYKEEIMSSLKGTKTEQNLLASFAGESQARNRYDFFASQAKKEGYEQIAAVFKETAENEKEHAKRFFKFLEGGNVKIEASYPAGIIGSTKENLEAAAMGEHEEYSELYPEFANTARDEGFNDIANIFNAVCVAEQQHEKRFLSLLKNIENNKVFKKEKVSRWKCRNCGYIFEGDSAPKRCPACQHPQAYFEILSENY